MFTGTSRGAGTTAKVSMIFAGLEEETPPRLLYDDKRQVLQSGGVDSFLMAVPRPLGPLNHIRYAYSTLMQTKYGGIYCL